MAKEEQAKKEEKPKKEAKSKKFGENPFVEISNDGKEVVSAMVVQATGVVLRTQSKEGVSKVYIPNVKIAEELSPKTKTGKQKVIGRKVVPMNYKIR